MQICTHSLKAGDAILSLDEGLEERVFIDGLCKDPVCRMCEERLYPNTMFHQCVGENKLEIPRLDIHQCHVCARYQFRVNLDMIKELPKEIQCECNF